MTTSLKFYSDSSLTTEVTTETIDQLADGTTGDIDKLVYLGSTNAAATFQANSDPGVDQITANIVDANSGSGVEVSNIKLALSSGGLAAAVAGDPLNVGLTINGGVAGAVPIYIRSDTPALAASDTDITIETNVVKETV